jgi:D-serine deaminase-like pyridoxal phosphate-dependent protein
MASTAGDGEPIGAEALARLDDAVLDWRFKAAPAEASGQTVRDFLDSAPRLSSLQTPLLTLNAVALRHNMDRLASWCAGHGVLLAPHGKTTMAPQLWSEQLNRGAWGISLANFAQLQVARAFGVRMLQLANSLTDPRAVAWVAGESERGCSIVSWVDSVQTVQLLARTLEAGHPGVVLDVLVELGGEGGRTGARSVVAALEVARAVAGADQLRLVGVSGYEGSLAHTASDDSLAKVNDYLLELKSLHGELLADGLYHDDADVLLSAGGSAYFDNVVDILGPCITQAGSGVGGRRVDLVIRSGAYVIHDDGFYRQISPFSRHGSKPFLAGMHGWARVISQPEPGLAILDAGKRDLPVDEGLPQPQAIGPGLGAPMRPMDGAAITAVNDQHCYLTFDAGTSTVNIGDVVRLGLSHPCTAMDKWALVPVLAGVDGDPPVVDLIRTFF